MPNEIQIECYFKSAEIAKLCEGSEHIIVYFKSSFGPGSTPTFEISADSFMEEASAGKSVKLAARAGDRAAGCPTPMQVNKFTMCEFNFFNEWL